MTNIDLYPLQDNYESKLSQPYDWTAAILYVDTVPTATLPSGAKVLFTINPWTSFAQTVEVDWWSSWQLNVSSTTVEKGNGINYSTTSHGAKSPIIISDNFAYWKEIATNVNSKADISNPVFTGSVGLPTYIDNTARDVAIPSPTGKELIKVAWDVQQYNSVTAQWEVLDTGTVTPNASTTVAGKVEKATPTEITNGTSTGGTGAELFVWPEDLKTVTDWINVSLWWIGWVNATLWETLTAGNVVSTDPDTNKIVRTYWQWVSATAISYGWSFTPNHVQSIKLSDNTVLFNSIYSWTWSFSKYALSAWTISWNTITVWTQQILTASWSSGVSNWWIVRISDNKFIMAYLPRGWTFWTEYNLTVVCGTVSGNTITLWTPVNILNQITPAITWWSITMVDTDKFVVNYAYSWANKIATWTVSWTTITMWWEQTGFAFLSTVGTYVSANKIALSDWANIRLYTFSWYIVTEWNNLAIGTTYTNYSLKDIWSSKSIFSGTNSSNSFAFIVDFSWSTPVKGTTVTVLNSSTTNDCCKVNNNQVCIVTGNNKYYFYNYTGTTLSPENNYTGTYNVTSFNWLNYLVSGMLIWSYTDSSNQIWHIVSNRIHNILGILQSSWVLNDVKAVKTSWWQSTIHTSLQPGRNIYLNNDWTLVYETWTFIGKTQSDTSILVWINYSGL